MKSIKLTPDRGTPDVTVRKFYDWLLAKRLKNEIPFNVVMTDSDASEQYGILVHCWSRQDRDNALKALKELSLGTYPAEKLKHESWLEAQGGKRIPNGVALTELAGAQIGGVFE